MLKKNICCILAEGIIIMGLCCSCADSQNAEETEKISEGVTIETDIPDTANAAVGDTADLVITPDLNGNGIPEEVRLIEMDDGQGLQLEIWENDELIDREAGHFAHTGWTSIFLCTLDGKDYLLRYHPTMYQGVGMYDYALSTLTDNEETVVQQSSVTFDINFGSPVHNGFEPEEIAAFMDEINILLSNSVELLNTDSDLQQTFRKEGRLFDSLWWLDGQEPVFTRDQNKSMLENLLHFRTAMTAAADSAVIEELDALPITEPLELFFYSGAGGWRTSLTLNPNGSFSGDYADADGDMIYVCQFHGQFGNVGKLTEASWMMTLEELVLDTGHEIGEEWVLTEDGHTTHYVASEPYGLDRADWTALKTGAQFILYSPNASGHEPGTELYGAWEFQSWMHNRKEFLGEEDKLGCWGLQNMESGRGFFEDA